MGRDRLANLSYLKHQLTEEEEGIGGNEIHEVVDRLTGVTYFLKEFHSRSGDRDEISRTVEILKKLDHPNLVKCLEVIEIKEKIYLLFEHTDVGSLSGDCISGESNLALVARQVLLGLRYLHRNNIRHGDIRLSNIFLNSRAQVKILYLGEKDSVGVGDVFVWDVWNLGLSILKLFKGLNEFPKSRKPPSTELYRFLLSCMKKTDKDAASNRNRWKTEKLLCHPFLNQLSAPTSFNEKMKVSDTHASPSVESEEINLREKRLKLYAEAEHGGIQDNESSEVPIIDYGNCIRHLALFLPDYEFSKKKLVQMWIAEECIKLEVTRRMEDVGNSCFDVLLNQKIIVPGKITYNCQRKYKVNKKSQVARFLKRGDYTRIDDGKLDMMNPQVLHLTWECSKLGTDLADAPLRRFKQLRTLRVVNSVFPRHQMWLTTFCGLKLLKTLDLSCNKIIEVPCSIGALGSLRFLDVSDNPIKELSIDRLFSLQTLRLMGCAELYKLPRGLECLINLRHLDLDIVGRFMSMPKRMGNLTKLQTLDAFIVGKDDGRGITELKNMNEITGSFTILRLDNVSSAEEAKEAALRDKQRIDLLKLNWRGDDEDETPDAIDILECLQPHFHLKRLHISGYCGSKLPSWISNPSFTDLSIVVLHECVNCDTLPSIGELPSLKSLVIMSMTNVRDINTLFCRNPKSHKGFIAFPKLEKLTLNHMSSLEEWSGIQDGDFPCLNSIIIEYCPKLSFLPSLSHLCSLRDLEINVCQQMISLPELPGSLKNFRVSDCPKMSKRWKDERREIACIKNVWIDFEKLSLH